jgi:hypothetical protein
MKAILAAKSKSKNSFLYVCAIIAIFPVPACLFQEDRHSCLFQKESFCRVRETHHNPEW